MQHIGLSIYRMLLNIYVSRSYVEYWNNVYGKKLKLCSDYEPTKHTRHIDLTS